MHQEIRSTKQYQKIVFMLVLTLITLLASCDGDSGTDDVVSPDENDSPISFTGTFVNEIAPFQQEGCGEGWFVSKVTMTFLQTGTSLTGTYTIDHSINETCCRVNCTESFTGAVERNSVVR
jgi:hypothetical protein